MLEQSAVASLVPVVAVDERACVNCHMCIAVCPVKYCIDGSGDKVTINPDLCIGCGMCVKACTQKARSVVDDAEAFLRAIARGEKIVAVAAPAIASSFPGSYGRFLGWLKSLGVAACFDVSFGAELTIRSYLHHIETSSPRLVISQPCPAIVNYIEIYRPELLPHLAPADSPMLHTIKMIREFYPEYRGHKVLVVSPCAAKKREFQETGIGDYNVTIRSFKAMIEERRVDLDRQPEADFDNAPAERAALFSTPGGLLRTAERDAPGISGKARKIEGPELVYPYLDRLGASLKSGVSPVLVDCLNCEYGCNAGPGTLNQDASPDEIERLVEDRAAVLRARYERGLGGARQARRKVASAVSRFWKPALYARAYVDRSGNYRLRTPDESRFAELYSAMLKDATEDHLNCAACGYKSCRGMAIAIFNGLNKKENCHLYRQRVIEREQRVVDGSTARLHDEIQKAMADVGAVSRELELLRRRAETQYTAIEDSAAAVAQMIATLSGASAMASGKREQLASLAESAQGGERDMDATIAAIKKAASGVSGVGEMIDVIRDVADRTNLLAMNAAIQAAHAGGAGKGFAVVSAEIRSLAEATSGQADRIGASLGAIIGQIKASDDLTLRTGGGIKAISRDVAEMAAEMSTLLGSFAELSSGGAQIAGGMDGLKTLSREVKVIYDDIAAEVEGILDKIRAVADISSETQATIASMAKS